MDGDEVGVWGWKEGGWGWLSINKNLHNYSVAIGRSLHVGLSRSLRGRRTPNWNTVLYGQPKKNSVDKPPRKTPSRSSGSK